MFNRNALKMWRINAYTYIHWRKMVNRDTNIQMHPLKVTKHIAAGQEFLVQYGNAKWFEDKNITYADVDYASTMWRPDLRPLPCRQSVHHTTGADGQRSFAVRKVVPSGTVVEVSLCVEVSVMVVDQLPFLWDFVLTGEMEMFSLFLQTGFCLLIRAHTACIFAEQGQANIGELAGQVLYFSFFFFFSARSFPLPKPTIIQSSLEHILCG